MRERVTFVVHGKPQPGGSKRAFYNKRTGRAMIVDANPEAKAWQKVVQQDALIAMRPSPPMAGPLRLSIMFYQDRPRSHYHTGKNAGNLRWDAPKWPQSKPDLTKLIRCTEDAMTGIVYKDDAQIVAQSASKQYGKPSVSIVVQRWV